MLNLAFAVWHLGEFPPPIMPESLKLTAQSYRRQAEMPPAARLIDVPFEDVLIFGWEKERLSTAYFSYWGLYAKKLIKVK